VREAMAIQAPTVTAEPEQPPEPKVMSSTIATLLVIAASLAMGLGWTAGVIYMSYPMFAIVLAWVLFRQKPAPRALSSVAGNHHRPPQTPLGPRPLLRTRPAQLVTE
jgi:hypothetical protein